MPRNFNRLAFALLALIFSSCGQLAATRCGLLVEAPELDRAQRIEDLTVAAFANSADPRVVAVCVGITGFLAEEREVIEARLPDGGVTTAAVARTRCTDQTIHVKNLEDSLTHEMAHAAQGCDEDSYQHRNWETDVYPWVRAVEAELMSR